MKLFIHFGRATAVALHLGERSDLSVHIFHPSTPNQQPPNRSPKSTQITAHFLYFLSLIWVTFHSKS